jgi:sterol desaturase/sphingolipid hydroxylase (fatty acid hydroxylase superfamily)
MIGFPLGLLYANAAEWVLHKHVLHGRGKDRKSVFSFHFHEHHRAARTNGMVDPDYRRSVLGAHAQGKEAAAVIGLMAIHAPLFPVAPFFTSAIWFSGVMYYRRHKRAHLDPEWGKKHLPWHYDHHMGPDQDMNWCVTWPWFDVVMGTRVPYLGTAREKADTARRMAREARKAAVAA